MVKKRELTAREALKRKLRTERDGVTSTNTHNMDVQSNISAGGGGGGAHPARVDMLCN